MSTSTSLRESDPDVTGPPAPPAVPRAGEWSGARTHAVIALVAAAAGLLALALDGGPVRLSLVLGFVLFGPGFGITSSVRVGSVLVRWTLAVTASLTLVTILSAGMAGADAWHPTGLHLFLIVLTVVFALSGLARQRAVPAADAEVATPAAAEQNPPAGPVRRWTPAVLLVGAVVLWIVALTGFHDAPIDDYGLTKALGVPFIAAVALTGLAFAIELFGPARRYLLVVSTAVLVMITRTGAAILFDVPKYPWTYKHLGVVDLFLQNGHALDAGDIYQQWPSFFTAAAQIAAVGGTSATDLAQWSPVFFCALQVLGVAGAVRALTADRRVVATAAMIFAASLWGETIYFAPQALAFTLMLGFVTIVFLWLRNVPQVAAGGSWFRRGWAMLVRGVPEVAPTTRGERAGAIIAAGLVFSAITSSHQLTPFLMLVGLGTLAVLRLVKPFWFVLIMAAIAILYVLPRQGVVSEYQLFTGFDIFSNAGGNNTESWATAGQTFSALVVRSMALIIWGVALLTALVFRKQLGRVVLALALGFTPFVFGLAGNYGGELVYRIYAFSLPWCGLVIALLVWNRKRRSDVVRPRRAGWSWAGGIVAGILVGAFALSSMQATEGQLTFGRISSGAVQASEYFYDNVEPGAVLVQATPAFPTRINANYRLVNLGRSVDPSLIDERSMRHLQLDAAQLPAVTDFVDGFSGSAHYLVISREMAAQAEYFGYLPTGSLDALAATLRASDQWTVFYENSDVTIFKQVQ